MTIDDDAINLDDYDAPDKPDFRRVGRGVPFVIHPVTGKRVRYSRSSNAGKVLDDESNLTDWKLRTVVAGAAQRPELMAQASVLDIDTDKKALREIAEDCLTAGKGQRRAIIGTAVHSMFDLVDRDTGWQPPPNFAGLVAQYGEIKTVWGLVPVDIETQCTCDQYALAGTLDRRYRLTRTLVAPDGNVIPIGSFIVADIKTGKELEYAAGSYATQLAAYVDSVRYNVETDEREPFYPESVKDWGLIIHANSSGTEIDVYWVDIEAGREGLRLAHAVRQWRRRDGLLSIGRRMPVLESIPPPPPPSMPVEVATAPVEASRLASRHEYLAGRVRAILAHSDVAKKALQIEWPKGIPGLKHEGHSWDDLDAILDAVEVVEKNHSIPWYPHWDDPQLEESRLSHPSNVWRHPKTTKATDDDRTVIRDHLMQHPRSGLVREWIAAGIAGGFNSATDTTALAHALGEFLAFDPDEWNDADISLMLDGSLRAMGYANGISDLGNFDPSDGPVLMSAAFAIASGTAMLLYDENDQPIVRTNVRRNREGQ